MQNIPTTTKYDAPLKRSNNPTVYGGRYDGRDTRQRQQEEESELTSSAHHDKHETSTL